MAATGFAAVILARAIRARQFASVLAVSVCAWLFVASIYYGSMNVLDDQFKVGKMAENPAYSEAHWQQLFDKYPVLARIFSTPSAKRSASDDNSAD